ncbi:TolC family protein [Gemmatimonas sp.]|uniref:TolC family protein n=1 Tax=Gemmatimonas sp. TaxID=1962908 RepID=UPI0039834CF3
MMSLVGARPWRRILTPPATTLMAALVITVLAPRLVLAQIAAGSGAPRPLSLAEALKLATGESEQIAIARAGSLRAQGQLGQARSALRPQLSTTMNWQKQLQNQFAAISQRSSGGGSGGGGSDTTSAADNPITRIFASQYNFNVGLSASQPLFTGGRATANIRAAKAARESADMGISSAQAQVQLDVTQSYYDALLTDRLVAISESSLVQSERTLRQVQLTRTVGSASEFELIRARVTRDNQRPGWLQSRTNRDLAYVRLRQLLNLPSDQPLALTDSIAESPVSAPVVNPAPITTVNVSAAEVLTIDPQVQAAVSRVLAGSDTGIGVRAPVKQAIKGVEVAQQQLRATKAQRLPSISATTNYQRLAYPVGILPTSLGDFFPNWTVGIGLSYPFFTGGRVRGEVQAAEATVIEARQRLRLAQEGATLDARQAVAQLTESEASWQASVGTAEQAQRAYDIAEVRFREGISTQLELSETRNQLQQALANRAQAARNLQVARKRLELLPYLPLPQGSTSTTGPTR